MTGNTSKEAKALHKSGTVRQKKRDFSRGVELLFGQVA